MANSDWSIEQLERDLAASFTLLGRMEQGGALAPGESAALAEGVLRCMNGALLKVAESLERQDALRRELGEVREAARLAETASHRLIQAQEARIRSLEDGLRALKAQSFLAEDALAHAPSDEYLARPLVVRSAQGDFLGVSLTPGQPLSMGDFVRLVEQGGDVGRIVCTLWEQRDGHWYLTMSLGGHAGGRRCYVLETGPVVTPSGNRVAELKGLSEDGTPVPDAFLLQMFRQLRETLQE